MKYANYAISTLLAGALFLIFSVPASAQDNEKKTDEPSGSKVEFFRGGVKVEKVGKDTTVVYFNNSDWDPFHGDHKWPCCKRNKYNGHWAGVDFGWNGYVDPNFSMTFPSNERYLNLNVARSLMVNLNPIELNLNLVKNHFGLTSGLGFTLNNYYFSDGYLLIPDSLKLTGYKIVDKDGKAADMKVNKMYIGWLTVPVLFEYQTNAKMRANSFHVSLGVIGAIRLEQYTKQAYYPRDITYYLQDQNGKNVGSFYVGDKYIRTHREYHLNPFKVDASLRIGWSFLNFFATYSLTPMYLKDQGPKVYPWTVGISLVGW
jgi:hypothetical protein